MSHSSLPSRIKHRISELVTAIELGKNQLQKPGPEWSKASIRRDIQACRAELARYGGESVLTPPAKEPIREHCAHIIPFPTDRRPNRLGI